MIKKSIFYVILTILAILFIAPVIIVFMNSFKGNLTISENVFSFPNQYSFVGIANYEKGLTFGAYSFFLAFFYSVFITVSSVLLILLACSMAAWFILRVNNKLCKIIYLVSVFSLVVPFQMVMFTLSKTADTLYLNTPFTIPIIYLGFGSGMAIFLFTGFMKSIPVEIEEAAAIDGCNPLQMFFKVIMPICKPIYITVAILNIMWIYNDYLLPYLTLDRTLYRTIPIHIQYLQGSYGTVDLGATMAIIIMTLIPIVSLYIIFQKHIIKGVVEGAVK